MDDTTVTEATKATDEQPQDTAAADAEATDAGQNTAADDTSTGQGEDALSLEDATKALRKARAEAARYRTQRNELQEAAGQAEAMRARVAELEAERDKAVAEALEATRAAIAAEAGVPAEFVTGDTAEAMQAMAKRLSDWRGTDATPRLPDVDAVGRQPRDDKDTIARQVLGIT